MKKRFAQILIASTMVAGMSTAQANTFDNVGLGLGYDVLGGGTLEVNYPVNNYLSVRGSMSKGLGLSETQLEDGILYKAKADGGIHRIALNYHPFEGNFFLSAGYAVNNFGFDVSGQGSESITVGSDTFQNANVSLAGAMDWDNAPTLSMGWGHSPNEGWGFMLEAGMIYTGAPDVSLSASGTYDNGGGPVDVLADPTFQNALKGEEDKLRDDLSDANFLPILQMQVTYRF